MPGLQAELMSLDEWAGSFLQAMENDGLDDTYTWYRYVKLMQANKGGFINVHDGSNPNPIPGMGVERLRFQDVNWTDVMWGPANSTQHDLSFSGGNEKVTYVCLPVICLMTPTCVGEKITINSILSVRVM